MKLTGTHTAEQAPSARPRSFGQALSASLDSKTTGLPRRTATHENGECTGQPGAPAVGTWNLGEVALHLAQVWLALTSLARQSHYTPPSLDRASGRRSSRPNLMAWGRKPWLGIQLRSFLRNP